jgi:hypothetical protein
MLDIDTLLTVLKRLEDVRAVCDDEDFYGIERAMSEVQDMIKSILRTAESM